MYGCDILSGGSGSKAPRILPLSACRTVPNNHSLCGVMCGPTIPFTKRCRVAAAALPDPSRERALVLVST